jgi:hypothetical protein
MRTVMIKIVVEDFESEQQVMGEVSLKQIDILRNQNINFIDAILPQLNRELTEIVGHHEKITRHLDATDLNHSEDE